MGTLEHYTVEIDHLPQETIEASDPEDAARKVREIILHRDSLQPLPDAESVQIKKPDRSLWGRNLTIGDFRKGPVTATTYGNDVVSDGPVRPPDP